MGAYQILEDLTAYDGLGRQYGEKQLHKIPDAKSVDRRKFILEKCVGKTVLDIGHASGELHDMIKSVAKHAFGIDRDAKVSPDYARIDLDDLTIANLPFTAADGIDLVVCGETLEHLSNPGWLLQRIAKDLPGSELLITVPNAFSSGSRKWLARGIENVNRDHSCWFSWKTLTNLVSRFGYSVKEFYWYGGEPLVAEGIIVVAVHGEKTV